jgi:hypothetical protein
VKFDVLTDGSVPEGSIFLLPKIHPVVYLAPGQREPTFQQKVDAVIEAYTQAARRGEVGVIKNVGEK